jgi:hypothetical protein
LHAIQAVSKLVPGLGHQQQCGPDFLARGKLHHSQTIGGMRSVGFRCEWLMLAVRRRAILVWHNIPLHYVFQPAR